ncbi:MAG: bifunctional phosphoglucose/phosphomannose isomerase [Thermoprotei archaeon]|nr:MAG: bifunctional phosphoglucose/phosphomannose isomerase [Thermoprotei archaeon]
MDLDDVTSYSKVDRDDMLSKILKFPDALVEAYDEFLNIDFPKEIRIGKISISYGYPSNIVICGMGGSAIGGDIVKYWLMERIPIHIDVVRNYVIPSYVNERTLALIVSYSGNTEEALFCLNHALRRKAMVITITSNGLLEHYSSMFGLPMFKLPKGFPPRAALPYLFTAMATAMEKIGIEIDVHRHINNAYEVLAHLREAIKPEVPLEKNIAKQLALSINGTIPLIYAYVTYYPAAFRFKTQLNENSKYPASCEVLPEMNHNGIMGWEARDLIKDLLAIFLIGGDEPKEVLTRIEVTSEIISDIGAKVMKINAKGTDLLTRMLYLIYLGDFTSYYLAIARDVNPTPVPSISRLKEELNARLSTKKRIDKSLRELLSE